MAIAAEDDRDRDMALYNVINFSDKGEMVMKLIFKVKSLSRSFSFDVNVV